MSENKEFPASCSRGAYECQVLSKEHLSPQIYSLRLACPEIARNAQPGQFVNIKIAQSLVPLLRRPFSVCRLNKSEGWFEVVWKVVGPGTRKMADFEAGDRVNVIGPLGQGFRISTETPVAAIVAGGIGVAPFPYLIDKLMTLGKQVHVFFGARTGHELGLADFFADQNINMILATEDGTRGRKGFVTGPLAEFLSKIEQIEMLQLFGCGPTPFLTTMSAISKQYRVQCQLSLETMMACGFGICVGCPVPSANADPAGQQYKLTCIEGPVFDSNEIVLGD